MARKYRHFVYDENQRFIYPTSDWGFKYLLGTEQNKDLLLGILNELLPELKIQDLKFITRDITIPIGKLRDASFDVHCSLADGSRVVIEMQNYVKSVFIDRSLIYTSAAVLEHFVNSRIHTYQVQKTIYIAFTGDAVYRSVPHTPVRLGLCDLDSATTSQLNDKLLQIFVELPKFAGSLKTITPDTPFIEKLSYVLMEMADCKDIPDNLGDEMLERLFRAADTQKMSTNTRDEYMRSILGEYEYQANLDVWKAEGLQEGRLEGREEGRLEGRLEGREEGRLEGLKEVAAKMKAAGITPQVIQEATGLSAEEIDTL